MIQLKCNKCGKLREKGPRDVARQLQQVTMVAKLMCVRDYQGIDDLSHEAAPVYIKMTEQRLLFHQELCRDCTQILKQLVTDWMLEDEAS